MKRSILKIIIPFTIFFLISCFNSDKKEINEVLDRREKAFELKDEKLYSELITEDYKSGVDDKIINKEGLINQFRINVLPFDNIEFIKTERQIFVNNNTAKVIVDTSVDLSIENQTVNHNTKELLGLIKINEKEWKLSKESDLDLFRGFVFGEK